MIYTYSFYPIDSRMYIMCDGNSALAVDPHPSAEAEKLFSQNGITDVTILLTHEHYDHISGVEWMKKLIPHTVVICSEECAKKIESPTANLSAFWDVLFIGKAEEIREYAHNMDVKPYSCFATHTFCENTELTWENHKVKAYITPGHSTGSVCYIIDDEILFSGDSLVQGMPTITRLPGGSKKDFAKITIPFLKGLNPNLNVFPGHGEVEKLSYYNYVLDKVTV